MRDTLILASVEIDGSKIVPSVTTFSAQISEASVATVKILTKAVYDAEP